MRHTSPMRGTGSGRSQINLAPCRLYVRLRPWRSRIEIKMQSTDQHEMTLVRAVASSSTGIVENHHAREHICPLLVR